LAVFDNHAANPFVLPSLPYDSDKDLDPVLLIGTAPYLIATSKAKPFNTLADVIAAAKQKPGAISYASVGSGSVGHLAMVLLSDRAGVKLVHVPYRGGGPAMTDALGGHVDLLVGSTALSMPQVKTGNLRALTQTGKARNPFLADVPTVSESGYPGFEAYAWWGIFAPAHTPKPIIERFGSEMTACLREERIAKQLIETQQVTLTLGGPQVLREFVASQMGVWGKVVKDHNIKSD
jgi:tripartite-type tricarboxylate transporter receptor subunit TctC